MTTSLTPAQIEILRRTRDGAPLWHGNMPVPRLADEVVLLLSLQLIERHSDATYRLTERGRAWLAQNDRA